MFEVLVLSMLLRYVSGTFATNNGACKKMSYAVAPHQIVAFLEDEYSDYEAFPTISQLAAKSNGAYTLNTVGASLAGLVLGYDINRDDGYVTLPNLGVLGLLMVLLSPGDQADEAVGQKRVLFCLPVTKGARDWIHNIGFVVFFLGMVGHIVVHSYYTDDCHDPAFDKHDLAFLVLPIIACVLLLCFLVLLKMPWLQCKANHPKILFFLETFSVVFALGVYFSHSVSSYVMPAREC